MGRYSVEERKKLNLKRFLEVYRIKPQRLLAEAIGEADTNLSSIEHEDNRDIYEDRTDLFKRSYRCFIVLKIWCIFGARLYLYGLLNTTLVHYIDSSLKVLKFPI